MPTLLVQFADREEHVPVRHRQGLTPGGEPRRILDETSHDLERRLERRSGEIRSLRIQRLSTRREPLLHPLKGIGRRPSTRLLPLRQRPRSHVPELPDLLVVRPGSPQRLERVEYKAQERYLLVPGRHEVE